MINIEPYEGQDKRGEHNNDGLELNGIEIILLRVVLIM